MSNFKEQKRLQSKIYNSSEWKYVRKEILARQPLCICRTFAQCVHHIVPFAEYLKLDFEKAKSMAYDIDNLLPLCLACHKKIHQYMKADDFDLELTREYFIEENKKKELFVLDFFLLKMIHPHSED